MANLSEPASKLLLDWLLLGASPTRPSECWVGLSSDPPNSRYASELPPVSGYSRLSVSFAAANSPAGTASNANALKFGPLSYSIATIQGLRIWDASSGGAMLWQGTLATARTVVTLDEVNLPAGALSVGLS
jgi:hypothetical protein